MEERKEEESLRSYFLIPSSFEQDPKSKEQDLKSKDLIYTGRGWKPKQKDASYRLNFDVRSKFPTAIIAVGDQFKGFFVAKYHEQGRKPNELL